jgi:hypothetical protein
LESGDEGPGPPGGMTPGPVPVHAPGPGPERWAEAGAASASAAIIAMPLKRCFISLILCCNRWRDGQGSSFRSVEALRQNPWSVKWATFCPPIG